MYTKYDTFSCCRVSSDSFFYKHGVQLVHQGLWGKELDVLRLIGKELTTTEIGKTRFLSRKTIEGYRKVLMDKSEARNMAGLVLFAVKYGLTKL